MVIFQPSHAGLELAKSSLLFLLLGLTGTLRSCKMMFSQNLGFTQYPVTNPEQIIGTPR